MPHVDTFPLFTDIPYTIIITTLSAPTKRKENAGPDKNLFPQVPRSASEIDFEMRRFVEMETPYQPSNPEEHVVDIISKAHAPIPPVVVEMSKHTWIPEEIHEGHGRWRQEATFSSSMNLRYTPTFVSDEVKIQVRPRYSPPDTLSSLLMLHVHSLSVHAIPPCGVLRVSKYSPPLHAGHNRLWHRVIHTTWLIVPRRDRPPCVSVLSVLFNWNHR